MDDQRFAQPSRERNERVATPDEEGRQFDAAAWAILASVFAIGLIVGIGAGILILT